MNNPGAGAEIVSMTTGGGIPLGQHRTTKAVGVPGKGKTDQSLIESERDRPNCQGPGTLNGSRPRRSMKTIETTDSMR